VALYYIIRFLTTENNMSEMDTPIAAQAVHIFKPDCVNCLYVNPKGVKHFSCHHTKPNKAGKRNIECPADKIVFVVGFTPELWAERYVKATSAGDNQRIIRIIQKLDGQDEQTQQTFWSLVQFQTAIAAGAVPYEDDEEVPPGIVDDGVDSQEGADENDEGTGEAAEGEGFDGEDAAESAEADQPEEAAEGEAAPTGGDDEDEDWNE
jgi:hypothetical protein